MKPGSLRTRYLVPSLGVLALSLACSAHAQTANEAGPSGTEESAETGGLTDIVVTAQRRSENLQKVPVTVTAVTAEGLSNAGIDGLNDLSAVVAGYAGPGDNSNQAPHVRGIGSQLIGAGNESAVAYYIDGAYIAVFNPGLLTLNNVAQVEVLKGPQGTLFGRNTTGGLISVTTRTPTDKVVAEAELGYANYETLSGSLYLAGPITEGIAADIAVQRSYQGEGWGTNLPDGKDVRRAPLNFSARSKWVFDLADRTKFTLAGDFERTRYVGMTDFRPVTGETSPTGVLAIATGWDTNNNTIADGRSRAWGVSGKLVQDFDFATLTSITAYRKARQDVLHIDADQTPLPSLQASNTIYNRQFSQEFQLAGASSTPLQWQVGAFYYNSKDRATPFATGPFLGAIDSRFTDGRLATESVSGYGQGTYKLTDHTRLTLGGRYTWEKRHLTGQRSFTAGGVSTVNFTADSSFAARVFTWRVALDQELSRDVLIYASANRGFKSGGYNLQDLTNPAFSPERITAYEAGVKSEMFDRTLRLNLAGFYYDYSNIQLTRLTPLNTLLVYNGPGARVYGVDLDMQARVSDRLTLSGALEVLNAKFGSFPNAIFYAPNANGRGYRQFTGDATGNDLPLAPRFTASMTGVYRLPTSIGEFQLSGTYAYNDGYFTEPDNRLRQPAHHMISANIMYTDPSEHITFKVWGQNLANEQVVNYYVTRTLTTSVALNAPRTYGVTLGFKY